MRLAPRPARLGNGRAAGHNRGMHRLLLISLAALLGACGSTSSDHTTSGQSARASTAGYDLYGAGTSAASAVPVETVLAEPAAYVGKPVKVSGPIVGTCLKKGCWMRLGSAEKNVFVKFKDYGFFVPTSGVDGREAIVEGQLAVETQSIDEVKHYLEDAGKHDEAAKVTAPRQVVSFMATGVAIKKPQ
jgi:Domain of unknown function (DUF4920)